jgi:hypothetical protein
MFDDLYQSQGGSRRNRFDSSTPSIAGSPARAGFRTAGVLLALALAACSHAENPPDPAAASSADTTATADATETSAPDLSRTGAASRGNGTTATATATSTQTGGTTTTTATGGTTTTASATVNSIETIIDDMRLPNDLVLRGYEQQKVGWYVGPGNNQLGNDPRTSNSPDWFKNAYPWLINDTYMNRLLPWAVIFDGVGHSATNTRVQLRNMVAYYKSRATGQWVSIGESAGLDGYSTPKSNLFNGSIAEDKRTNADGSVEIKPPSDINFAWHGWWQKGRAPIPGSDIAALYVSLQARLVVDNPALPDDRAAARLLVWAGSDYYGESSWTVPNPGAASSRIKRVTNSWQAFSATTLTDVGAQEPGGGITSAQLRAAPPPIK